MIEVRTKDLQFPVKRRSPRLWQEDPTSVSHFKSHPIVFRTWQGNVLIRLAHTVPDYQYDECGIRVI